MSFQIDSSAQAIIETSWSKGFIILAKGIRGEVHIVSEKMPIKSLEQQLNDVISVKLKDQRVFRGHLTRCDMYMNLTLADAEELENDETRAKYGQVLIRGNNILWIQIPA